ncbi:MAG: hypothetical protein KDA96_12525, partial [Planctomycetaceae bacterium]|nr:hypothetical protein [Planctomycetaceae bacterium]
MNRQRLPVILIFCLTCIWQSTAWGQATLPLRMRLELLGQRSRTGGPVPVQIKLEYSANQTLQGDLVLELHDSSTTLHAESKTAVIRFTDIALFKGDRIFNAVLPPTVGYVNENCMISPWFEADGKRIPLSVSKVDGKPVPVEILMPSPSDRHTLICSVSASSSYLTPSANRAFLSANVALEPFNPEFGDATSLGLVQLNNLPGNRSFTSMKGRSVVHNVVSWRVTELPEAPLMYCAFDLVILADGAVGRLTQPQFEGLYRWVQAGGSLCILPDEPMTARHVEYVRRLFREDAELAEAIRSDDDGELVIDAKPTENILTAYCGLGRVAVVRSHTDLASVLTTPDIGRLVAFLWRVRDSLAVRLGGPWYTVEQFEGLLSRKDVHQYPRGFYVTDRGASAVVPEPAKQHILRDLPYQANYNERLSADRTPLLNVAESNLLPREVEMVPMWVISLILLAYVLTIGPVDYFVLGWLRLRKFTWVAFPVVTAVFTWITMSVADSYMQATDNGGSIVITDLVGDGEVVRQSRVDMLFYGDRVEARREHQQSFYVPVGGTATLDHWGQSQVDRGGREDIMQFVGTFPNTYESLRVMHKWSPVMLRSLTLEPSEFEVPAISWDRGELLTTPQGQQEIVDELSKWYEKRQVHDWQVWLAHGGLFRELRSGTTQHPSVDDDRVQYSYNYSDETRLIPAILQATAPSGRNQTSGFFHIVTQVSPQGAGNLEDLPLVDLTDPKQMALVVIEGISENESSRAFSPSGLD